MMTSFKRLLALISLLTIFLAVQPAQGHGYIVRAIPENRAVLDRAPPRLQYWFSEPLERDFSALNVRNQDGDVIAVGGVAENDASLMTVQLPPDLPDGAYIVELRPAFASDGHVVAESRVFFVGEEIGGVAGKSATENPIVLEVVWRAITLTAMMVLFGTFTLYANILVPAWGNKDYRAGLLPPRVMRRLHWIIAIALVVLIGGNILALIQQTMTFFGIGFVKALDSNFWSVVRIGSRFGDIWNIRMIFIGIVGMLFLGSIFLKDDQPESVRAFLTAGAWIMALIIGASSVLSHSAGSLLLPWLGIAVDWLHAVAVGFWAGGLIALVLILPTALKPYHGEARRLALLAVLRRYTRIATASVFIVIATGLYSATTWIFTPDDAQTTFGAALGLKLILVAGLVAVGALHHIALHPDRFARFTRLAVKVQNFTGSLRLEALLATITLIAVGVLSATPVPVPDFAEQQIDPPTQAQIIGDLTVVLTIQPGGPGVNTVDATITRNGEREGDLQIALTYVNPARDLRYGPQIADPAEPGLYVTVGDEIDRTGGWWTLLDMTDPSGDSTRLAFDWTITDSASIVQSIQPRLTNILALIAVIAAVAFALYPSATRVYHLLDLSPLTVTVAVSASVAVAFLLVVGFAVLNQSQQRYNDKINPPPQIVNAVLPTQASLDRGARFFDDLCRANWENAAPDFTAFKDRLPRARDEELYDALLNGWRDLPPCADDLSLFQRWDVVNYLRILTP